MLHKSMLGFTALAALTSFSAFASSETQEIDLYGFFLGLDADGFAGLIEYADFKFCKISAETNLVDHHHCFVVEIDENAGPNPELFTGSDEPDLVYMDDFALVKANFYDGYDSLYATMSFDETAPGCTSRNEATVTLEDTTVVQIGYDFLNIVLGSLPGDIITVDCDRAIAFATSF